MPIINFSHQKGGVGKSLLSYHLAYLLHMIIMMFSYLIIDNRKKSLFHSQSYASHKLQQHSIPIKTVHSKARVNRHSSIASMTNPISSFIDSLVAFDKSLIQRLGINLGGDH